MASSSATARAEPAASASGTASTTAQPPVASKSAPIVKLDKQVFGKGKVLVHGAIFREETAHTDNARLVTGRGAFLTMAIHHMPFEDAPAELVFSGQVFMPEGAIQFPIEFEIRGDPNALLGSGPYSVSATISRGEDGEGPRKLVSEDANEMKRASAGVKMNITVGGLEPCGSPGSGGYCGD